VTFAFHGYQDHVWTLLSRLVDVLLFAGWMAMLGTAPFVAMAALTVLLEDSSSGPISISSVFVAMTLVALPSALLAAAVGWLARTSPSLNRWYGLDNIYRLAFFGVAAAYAIPSIVTLLLAFEVALFSVFLSGALWLLTGVAMTYLAVWGIRVYGDKIRPLVSRWTPLVMPDLPAGASGQSLADKVATR
jgi:hypothetical protein